MILLFLTLFCAIHVAFASKNSDTRVQQILDNPEVDKCTAIAVGPKATIDGSLLNTHTADCLDCDWRVNRIPARDWPEGTTRPIYKISSKYPRQVRSDRFTWSPENLEVFFICMFVYSFIYYLIIYFRSYESFIKLTYLFFLISFFLYYRMYL